MPPSPDFDIDALNEATEKALGRPMFGYWLFFNEDNCHEVLAAHVRHVFPSGYHGTPTDSFSIQTASSFSLSFAADPNLWATAIAPVGAFKKWLLEDKTAEIASWITDEVSYFLSVFNMSLTIVRTRNISRESRNRWTSVQLLVGISALFAS